MNFKRSMNTFGLAVAGIIFGFTMLVSSCQNSDKKSNTSGIIL